MLLLYTNRISPRLNYITSQIFVNLMGVDTQITTDLEYFIKSDKYKISYALQPIGNEFFIQSAGLLFEKGIRNIELYIKYWDKIPYFFCSKAGHIPFDILSASFYLLSRYEEYLTLKGKKAFFSYKDSIAHQHDFLDLPIIDIWIIKLKELLLEQYPKLKFRQTEFRQTSVIDVAKAFKYKHKGFIRSLTRTGVDLLTFQISTIWERFKTLLGLQKDPFDCYEKLIDFHKKHQIDSIFFFLLAKYSVFDKGISYNNLKYKSLIKYTADYSIVSVLASYHSIDNIKELIKERNRINGIINRSVRRFRAYCTKLSFPDFYRNIAEAQYNEDYSMGYQNTFGFRAGTCNPFYFYDLILEIQLPVLVNSFCIYNPTLKDTLPNIKAIKQVIRTVKGHFLCVFSNETLSSNEGFSLYKTIMKL